MRSTFFKLTLASLTAVAAFAGTESSANAFWWRHGGSSGSYGSSGGSSGGYGSSGGWGSSGGSSGGWGSSGGSSGGYGSSGGSSGGWGGGGLFGHHHRANWGSYGSSGGSSGGWGSSGGSSGGWGSSGGSSGGWGSSGGSSGGWVSGYGSTNGVIIDNGTAPAMTPPGAMPGTMPAAPAPGPAMPAPGGAAPPKPAGVQLNPANDFRSATVNVQVPGEAKVFVNGMATTSTGAYRRYVSNGLEPGYSYTYELRAEIVRDGKTVTDVKSIKLKAGENANINFNFEKGDNQIAKEPVRTSLTLHVPANAKVYLSGNPTALNGGVREFATTKLAAGEKWNDYVVRVELQRDGQLLSKEQTVSLNGGDNKQLTIDFDVAQVARNGR